jgi:exopolysaccharide production protein ExoQ
MGKLIATVVFALLIWQLYRWMKDDEARTSKALWLPTFWLFIGSSRNLSEWLHMSSGGSERYMEGNPLDRLVLTIVLALGVVVLCRRAQAVSRLLRANMAILLYFAYCLTSVLWSEYSGVAFKRWFRGTGDVVMVLIILTDPYWVAALKRVLTRLGTSLVPLSLLFSRWYPQFGRQFSHAGEPYWSGVTTEKNALGSLCVVFGLAFLYYFLEIYRDEKGPRRKGQLIGHTIVLGIALYLLFQSRSATALASFFLAAVPMILTFRYRGLRVPAFVHTMVLGILGVAASVAFLSVGSDMLSEMGRNSTLTGRTVVWRSALSLAENPIVGTGFASFWLGRRYDQMAALTGMYLNQAHNGFLEIYLNLGWIGVALIVLILVIGYRRAVKGVTLMWPVANLGLAYLMVAVTENFTEASFGMAGCVWIGFLTTTMGLSQVPRSSELSFPGSDPAENLENGKPKWLSPIPTGRRSALTDFRKPPARRPSFREAEDLHRGPRHSR